MPPAAARQQQAESDNPQPPELDRRNRPENRTRSDDLQLAGAVCRFELVRGTGDGELARLAELQHGCVHRHQVLASGIGKNALAHRLRTGRLRRMMPSVYSVGSVRRGPLSRSMSAALHFKGDALVTACAAAHVWGYLDTTQQLDERDPVDVLLVGRNAEPVEGVRIHRVRSLARQDVRWRNGIPVTSPALTLAYLAGELGEFELEAAAAIAFRNGLRASQLRNVIERNPRVKGVAELRRLLEDPTQAHDTRSRWERKLLRLLRAAELPLPLTNVSAAGHMVDMLWPDLKLVVEFDGWTVHGDGRRTAFETDRLRDQNLAASGHQVLRVTARQIDSAPYALVARLASTMTAIRFSR